MRTSPAKTLDELRPHFMMFCAIMCGLGVTIALENELGVDRALIAGLSVFFGLSAVLLTLREIVDLLSKIKNDRR